MLRFDVAGKPRQHLGRDHAVDALGAGQIEEGLVDRERLDQRRQRLHGLAHLAADADIFRHVGPDHGRMRAQRQRLEHRHRRAHAIGARDVAGGRHHAALAAADDHGLVGDLGIVALLDGGVERVAVDMRERERGQGVVAHEARGAAMRGSACALSSRSPRQSRQKQVGAAQPLAPAALTARRAPIAGSPSTSRAAAMLVGCSSRGLGERLHGRVVAQHEIEHAGQKLRIGGGFAQGFRADPGFGQEQAQPLGIAGDEVQGLNRNDFSDFPGVLNRLFQASVCLSVNLWSLICKPSCPSLSNRFKQAETTSRK